VQGWTVALFAGTGCTPPGGLLTHCSAIAAVYSVGGANEAILTAFEAAGRPCRVFIGHDLYLACLLVMQAHGVAHAGRPVRTSR
jgi:hypothetical protein